MRIQLKLSAAALARQLNTSPRTYAAWEHDENDKVPGVVFVACSLLLERDKWVMNQVVGKIMDRIERDFPNGIRSEYVPEEETE